MCMQGSWVERMYEEEEEWGRGSEVEDIKTMAGFQRPKRRSI